MKTRKSSGCVVFNETKKGNVEFLLVTSSGSGNWVFPKGGIEFGMTAESSAAKEVREEAGVEVNVGLSLGNYRYVKNGILNEVQMFAAYYTGEAKEWKEENKRERKWFKADKAMSKVDPYLAAFIADVADMVEANNIHEDSKRVN